MHIPVLYQPVLNTLSPRAGGSYIDATLGGGGHAEGILQASAPDGRLLGLDADEKAIIRVRERLQPYADRLILVHSNFRHLDVVARNHGFDQADGILIDLGVSSYQIDQPDSGFSFQQDGPLDMRFDASTGLSAADVVNTFDAEQIADILYQFGEEHRSRRIARAIVDARPVRSTLHLAEIVSRAVGGRRGERIHPATRTFLALRIFCNDELGALEAVLPQAIDLLKPLAALSVLTFHSIEDRIVKKYFRRESQDCICPPRTPMCVCRHHAQVTELYHKGLTPDPAELALNPRTRSSRLRAVRKLSATGEAN